MKPIDKETLKIAADKVMLSIDDEQYDSLILELNELCEQMDEIASIEGIENAEPMSFPYDVTTSYLREDVAENPLSKEEVLQNSRDVEDGQIRLPKVVK